MSFDDRVRRHLHEAGDGLAVSGGDVDAVRGRAQRRARRQQAAIGTMGATVVVAVIGLSVVLLRSGGGADLQSVSSLPLDAGAQVSLAPRSTATVTTLPAIEAEQGPTSSATPLGEEGVESGPALEPAVGDADEGPEQPEAVVAATSTTLVAGDRPATAPSVWGQLDAPIAAVATEYDFIGEVLIARTTGEWFLEDGTGWQVLPPLPSELHNVAAARDAAGIIFLASERDLSACSRQQVLSRHDGGSWTEVGVLDESRPGVLVHLLDAEVRVTEQVTVMSRLEEFRLDPACMLEALGLEGTDATLEADGLGYVDGSGDDQLVLLDDVVAQLEFDELATQLLDGPVRRRSIVARTGSTASATSSDIGTPWSIQVEAVWAADAVGATQAASLGELGGAVAAVNATGTELSMYPTDWSPDGLDGFDGYTVRDGQVLAWQMDGGWLRWDGSAVAKIDAPVSLGADDRILDVVASADGWLVLVHDGTATWLRASLPDGSVEADVALLTISGKDTPSARLGLVAGQPHVVADTPAGASVFHRQAG